MVDVAGGTGIAGETVARLRAAGLDVGAVARVVRAGLDEDFRYGPDVTSAATVAGRTMTADVIAREDGVLAGVPVALAVLDLVAEYLAGAAWTDAAGPDRAGQGAAGQAAAGPDATGQGAGRYAAGLGATGLGATDGNGTAAGEAGVTRRAVGRGDGSAAGTRGGGVGDRLVTWTVLVSDGTRIGAGDAVLRVSGAAVAVLGAERTMLNFLTHLSGIASATRTWADAVAGTGAVIRDTRKTTPGLRALEKYAVACGGGENHRMGLGDAALVKDNHVAAAGGVAAAVAAVRAAAPAGLVVEVECDSVAQVREALAAGARFLLLDNMGAGELRQAVAAARAYDGVRLEASGGLRLDNAREVAETGVDYLAVGALTHSSRVLDLGLDAVVAP